MASDHGLVFSSYYEVPDCILRINDSLITRLGRTNRSDDRPNVPSRRALWRHVFAKGWDTTSKNPVPRNEPTPSPAEGYAVYIGTFINDLPPLPIPSNLQITTGFWGPSGPSPTFPPLATCRKAGTPAYLRVNLNPQANLGITFETIDAKGSLAYPQGRDPTATVLSTMSHIYDNILLDDKFPTIRDARSAAMLRHDGAMIYKLSMYNLDWIIYWARNRLLKATEILAKLDPSSWDMIEWVTAGGESSHPRVTAEVRGIVPGPKVPVVENDEEDYGMLRTITTCADVIRELTRIEVLEERIGLHMRTVLDNSGL